MNRLDYQWKRQLKNEQEQAVFTKLINKTLLQNILTQHIGKTDAPQCYDNHKALL